MNKSSTLGFVCFSSGGKADIGNDENVNPVSANDIGRDGDNRNGICLSGSLLLGI